VIIERGDVHLLINTEAATKWARTNCHLPWPIIRYSPSGESHSDTHPLSLETRKHTPLGWAR
jgi:hypothetical protein